MEKTSQNSMEVKMECNHLQELAVAEIDVIKRHLKEHKWFQHIANDEDAIRDFIEKYGWLMREMYCEYACPDRDKCNPEHLFFNKN